MGLHLADMVTRAQEASMAVFLFAVLLVVHLTSFAFLVISQLVTGHQLTLVSLKTCGIHNCVNRWRMATRIGTEIGFFVDTYTKVAI